MRSNNDTALIVLVLLLTFPVWIGLAGGVIGAVGAVFGSIVGIFWGASHGLNELFFCGPFHGNYFLIAAIVVVLIIMAQRKSAR